MEKLKNITDENIAELYIAWDIKEKNTISLEKKMSSKTEVVKKFFSLNEDIQTIIYHLIFSFDKTDNISVRDIAEKFNIKTKRQTAQKIDVESLIESGFVYIKKRRAKLNATDDVVVIISDLKDIIKEVFIESIEDIQKSLYEDKFTKSILKDNFKQIKDLYSFGNYFEKNELDDFYINTSMPDSKDIKSIEKTKHDINYNYNIFYENKIIDFYFLYDNETVKSCIAISNTEVIREIEKTLLSDIKDEAYIFNHANIIYDIDTFINKIPEYKVKLPINIRTRNTFEEGLKTKNASFEYIYDICVSLSLIKIENENIISVNKTAYKYIKSLTIDECKDCIKKVLLNEDVYQIILDILQEKSPLSKEDVRRILHSVSSKKYTYAEINKYLYNIFVKGAVKAAFLDNDIISISINKDEKGKCIMTGSFEFMLISHPSFTDDFIYMCALFSDMEEKENGQYVINITEESISRGKALSKYSEMYNLYNFIKELKENLLKSGHSVQTHFDSTLKRWLDKSYNVVICESVILIKLTNSDKLEELIHSLKRSHIEITRVGDEYIAISSDKNEKNRLIKFLRSKKINTDFVDFDDI